MGYTAPKKHLHREFLYLNQDTIVNSLSALEAGKIDEIIQKANQAREGGFGAGLSAGPVEATGGRKKASSIEEEMVRTRTIFSAFDAWYTHLSSQDAIGVFDEWTMEVRDALSVGDTIEFQGRLTLTPVHKVIRTYLSFAEEAHQPGSLFEQKGDELKATKKTAGIMHAMVGGKDAPVHLPVYMAPFDVDDPRILARLDEQYMLSPKEGVDGFYRVICQVDEILREGDEVSAIRVIRDVPPTPIEVSTISEALANFIDPAENLGVTIEASDILIPYPAVLVRPIAIFR